MAKKPATKLAKRGRLRKVQFKEAFASETAFTAWLATAEGTALLSGALDMELESVATEHSIGGLRADLICRKKTDGSLVIVENQLGASDHKHLGQVLTYAAGAHASVIVWIAEQFKDRHRAAVDWQNEVTNDDIRVYALEIEVWKIDGPKVAPKLNVVSQPNDWRKVVQIQVDPPEEPASGFDRFAFWTVVDDMIEREGPVGKPPPSNAAAAYFGTLRNSQFRLRGSFSKRKQHLQVALEVRKENGYAHAKLLQDDTKEIESVVGKALEWKFGKKGEASIISLEKTGVNIEDDKKWNDYANWLVSYLKKFHDAFWDRIMRLDASEWIDPDDDDQDIAGNDDDRPEEE